MDIQTIMRAFMGVVGIVVWVMLWVYSRGQYKSLNKSNKVVEDQEESKNTLKPDTSEPVISFVKTVKDNPKRFTYVKGTLSCYKVLTDTFTGEVFEIEEVGLCKWLLNRPNIILTKDEMGYIDKEIVTPYNERKARYIETRENRRCIQEKRKELQERRRLTKIYKQEK